MVGLIPCFPANSSIALIEAGWAPPDPINWYPYKTKANAGTGIASKLMVKGKILANGARTGMYLLGVS